ncbi:hypothetical protein, partial [Vibrio vulnificus]|uniref:hypothetical protein n=1 Tax=Vibrio vulnificus TaxID=672 RepID=UPI0039B6BF54
MENQFARTMNNGLAAIVFFHPGEQQFTGAEKVALVQKQLGIGKHQGKVPKSQTIQQQKHTEKTGGKRRNNPKHL